MARARLLLGVALAALAPAAVAGAQEPAPPPAVAIEQLKDLETRWGRAFVD